MQRKKVTGFLQWIFLFMMGIAVLPVPQDGGAGSVMRLLFQHPAAARMAHAADLHFSSKWPHERSDLKPDPALMHGRLPNGFRYVMMKNTTPKDRVSLHLNVMAGSFHERDSQRGLAHYLEHMLFNGSTHFPPGELVKYFQQIGMQFGPDANAHTGFFETVYDVLLPDGSRDSLAKGLLVLQDYAMGALLLPEEIERERRVILAEKRSRDSAQYRTFVSTLSFEFPDARIARRMPIGVEQVIRDADRAELKDYYDTWYRPERTVLVMVGDFDPAVAEALVIEKFSDFHPRKPARPEPNFGPVDHSGIDIFHHFEQEAGKTSVGIEVIEKVPHRPDGLDLQKRLLTENIADRIVQNRLDALLRQPDTPFTVASVGSGLFLRRVKMAVIQADCEPENWEPSLSRIEQVLRRALVHGFRPEELDRVKKDVLAELNNAVKRAATRESGDIARQLIRHINADRVFMSPEQEKKRFAPVVEALTPETVHEAFKRLWSADHRLLLVTGDADLSDRPLSPEAAVRTAYSASRKMPVKQRESKARKPFPYLPDPARTAEVLQRRQVEEIGVTLVDFENGVRLNIKPTRFKEDEIIAGIRFPYGKSSEPEHLAGLAVLGADVVNESALGFLNREELDRALAGKSTDVAFHIEPDAFHLRGTTVRSELRLLFQLFYAHLNDPAFRKDAYALVMERFNQQYKELATSTDGAMILRGRRFLAGGDSRFGLPPHAQFRSLTLDAVRDWIAPVLQDSVFEFSIVGDFQVEKVVDLGRQYFGSLSGRKLPAAPESSRHPSFPRSRTLTHYVDTKIPKGLVVVAYPTEDIWQIHRTRRLNILGEVFSDRLRERIREKLGAAYSPFAYNRPSRAYKGYGRFNIFVQTAPEEIDAVVSEIRAISGEMSRNGVTGDALRRALEPTLTSIKDMLETNGYWLNTVLSGSRQHPEQLKWPRSIVSDYASITARELEKLAARYLDGDAAAVIRVMPESYRKGRD